MMARAALLSLALAGVARAGPADAPPPRPERRGFHAPDHVKLQTGGFLGMITVGAGLAALSDHLTATLYYGWVPASVGGDEIHTFALTTSGRAPRIRLGELDWIPGYLGVGAIYAPGDGFFTLVPDRYTSGYYMPTAIRAIVLAGSELELRKPLESGFAGHALFVETVALDVYVDHWLGNRDRISPLEMLSTAVGYKARLP